MSSRSRRPAEAPTIAGYTFQKLLGQGGFADVFLYKQGTPRRDVAIKVLLEDMVRADGAARLNAEADAMAQLSQHPNIVTVFHSGVAEDGRPYLVMDFYPKPSLAKVIRQQKLTVPQVLSIGVQMAGAVESAHQFGILHRDIKPANILGDRFNKPVLGDFGIAMTVTEALQGVEGLSVPWSPPEAFAAKPWAGPQSDVWGLAATLYTLLTGRPPFDIPGMDNKPYAQADRIRNSPYRKLARPDAPASFDQVLATAMAKEPINRFATMRSFGVALQEVEQELGISPTRLDIISDDGDDDDERGHGLGEHDDDDEAPGTKLRPISVIDPDDTGSHTSQRSSLTGPSLDSSPAVTDRGVTGWPSASDFPSSTDAWSGIGSSSRFTPEGSVGSPSLERVTTPATTPASPAPSSVPAPPVSQPSSSASAGASGSASAFHSRNYAREADSWDTDGLEETMMRRPEARPSATSPTSTEAWVTPGGGADEHPPEAAKERQRRLVPVLVAVLAVILIAILVIVVVRSGDPPPPSDDETASSTPTVIVQDPLGGLAPAAPVDLVGVANGTGTEVVYTWTNPDPEEGDTYLVYRTDDSGNTYEQAQLTEEAQYTVPFPEGEDIVCLQVETLRSNVASERSLNECVTR
ncbi:MAG: serine/threonine protein kinase [Propionibacteriaceae bacterium]|nr:serine/threonine protein kinase [Propionibacteriaceae bacterium]